MVKKHYVLLHYRDVDLTNDTESGIQKIHTVFHRAYFDIAAGRARFEFDRNRSFDRGL